MEVCIKCSSLYIATWIACVDVGGMLTDWFMLECPITQGDDTLAPTMFSMYINDIASEIKSMNMGVPMDDENVSILLYADGIALISESPELDFQEC